MTLEPTRNTDVVALLPSGTVPGQWLGAVQPRPGRCTMINVTDANGIIAARTVNSVNDQCRADLSSTIPLLASDFNSTLINPKDGNSVPSPGAPTWKNGFFSMGYGMLLNKSGSTSFVNGSLSAKIALEPTAWTTTGIAFRGSTNAEGKYNGYVYQIDRGDCTKPPSAVVWKWVNGAQTNPQVLNFPLTGINSINPTNPNELQIDVSGNTFTANVNGSTIVTGGLDPAYVGTSYGVRNGTSKASTVTDLKLTPVN